jgi:BMFP domain-containing protein YqiC
MSARAAAAIDAVRAAIRAADTLLDPADRAAFDAQLLAELGARRKTAPTGDTIEELAARHGAAMRAARKRARGT